MTLNDPVYVEAAQALARRIVREGGTTSHRSRPIRLTTLPVPAPSARADRAARSLYTAELEHYRKDREAATALATKPLGPLPAGMEPADLAAWTAVANVLLNLDGVLTKGLSRLPWTPIANDLPWTCQLARAQTRRHFLKRSQAGLGAIALAMLLDGDGKARGAGALAGPQPSSADNPMAVRPPHFAPKAKSVIYLHMSGGPPQQDLFDYKPKLVKLNMQPCPDELLKNQQFAFIKGHPKLLGTPYKFAQYGKSGAVVSDLLDALAQRVDDIAIIKSMHTDQFNHAPAELFIYTGSSRNGGAAMGSWITYGLGSENQDLPGFVVLISGGTDPTGGKALWSTGYLPSVYQGVQCRTGGDPILYVSDPKGMDRADRRRTLDALRSSTNRASRVWRPGNAHAHQPVRAGVPHADGRARGHGHPPGTERSCEQYGANPGASSFANNCLLARRLVERGVRYVQLYDWGWDCHGTGTGDDIVKHLPEKCKDIDRPIAALLADLKQRGLLDETLVIWGGEFGRTSMNEARGGSKFLGRDHHPHCFTHLDGRRRHQAGHHPRRDRRARLSHRREPSQRSRLAGHDPAPAGPRCLEAHLPLPGIAAEADRPRGRGQDSQRAAGLKRTTRRARSPPRRLI